MLVWFYGNWEGYCTVFYSSLKSTTSLLIILNQNLLGHYTRKWLIWCLHVQIHILSWRALLLSDPRGSLVIEQLYRCRAPMEYHCRHQPVCLNCASRHSACICRSILTENLILRLTPSQTSKLSSCEFVIRVTSWSTQLILKGNGTANSWCTEFRS